MKKLENKAEYLQLSELVKLENNPRTIKKADFEKLKTSIKNNPDYFEARPIICSDRTGENVILGGNQRYEAAKALGIEEVPVIVLHNLDEEREREIVIRDNVSNGDWDFDILANEWDADLLSEWGVGIRGLDIEIDRITDEASLNVLSELSDDTNYDSMKFFRKRVDGEIEQEIERGIEKGEIRDEIAEILKVRASQCSIFNFDEIIKFYRSGDASETEKKLLERLYLVFLTPKKAFEGGVLEVVKLTGEIVDRKLTKEVE